ncbi:hypothetical protein ABL78_0417 [Leptomonas seymouri]|uniref:Transcription factor CBF/NF-Y/archaeal histone domain-containing protein n=1 Tax=Leptomonas seymouri TaxID=5684 RepID=A0A0N0P9A7_LEPSE|nr:hypothetical protein ABL78_0417 [Leptomonas seymouri]|eukprot:KPI90487.1 hypothetical protein ABL78_0417 [Leptomonas seymouri]
MSSQDMKQGDEEATYGETFEATFDPDGQGEEEEEEAAPYLVPRLAAYAEASSSSSIASDEDKKAHTENEDGTTFQADELDEEGRTPHVLIARDSGERSAAHVTDDGATEEPRERASEEESSLEKAEGSDAMQANEQDPTYIGSSGEDEVEVSEEDAHEDDGDRGSNRATASHYASAFAHSRVKELLKYEGSSSIVSRDAATAACEAVALLMRDLVATTAAEATRRSRKTLTYDDVARVVQLFDRFSFLADVVPPASSSSSGSGLGAGKSIVVGSHLQSLPAAGGDVPSKKSVDASPRSKSAHWQGRGRSAPSVGSERSTVKRSKTAQARAVHSAVSPLHPQPGGMRQATLRF